MSKLVLILIICVMLKECVSQYMPYRRIKRGKYYANPPQRFYSRPPFTFPGGGHISHTPPLYRDDEPPYPGSRPKVSNPTTNEGLGDEDINNLFKYLSKKDLDRIIELAKAKERENGYDPNNITPSSDKYNEFKLRESAFRESSNPYDNFNNKDHYGPETEIESPQDIFSKYSSEYSKFLHQKDDSKIRPMIPDTNYSLQTNNYKQKPELNAYVTEPMPMKYFQVSTPRYQSYINPTGNNVENMNNYPDNNSQRYAEHNNSKYNNPISNQVRENQNYDDNINRFPPIYAESPTSTTYSNSYSGSPNQVKDLFEYAQPYSNNYQNQNDFFNPETKENLPKPLNLRDDTEYELSYTNKVPTVTKLESYKVENFGDLPLMEYNSKLTSLDSYKVPHYTVISPSSTYSAPPAPSSSPLISSPYGQSSVPVETAPPVSAAWQQSDAHLKAIKIWTNKSRGAAYTLHDDGTLTPERPLKPKPSYSSYGYP